MAIFRAAPAVLTAFLILARLPAAAGAAEAFLAGLDDVPLMPGLHESQEAGVMFDTPNGRIAEAYAEGVVSRDKVLGFYAATLPQLGWSRIDDTLYRRDSEMLRLELTGGKPLVLRLQISPE